MGYLSSEDQQLILDFYFRCGEEADIARGRDLIACNPEAARLYATLEDTLTELDSIKYEPCPDNLVALTVARLKLASTGDGIGAGKLGDLLKAEQENIEFMPARLPAHRGAGRFWRPAFEILATAAAIMIVAGILFPSFGAIRDRSRQVACANNQRQIGQAMATFSNDQQERIGTVRVPSGAPWWKIGYQGPETQSNTRYVWELVKQGYIDGGAFFCGGHADGEQLRYDARQMADLQDFPSRRHISYSFILLCDKNDRLAQQGRRVIASDLNPIFQNRVNFHPSAYQQLNEFERIQLNEQLREMMSENHRRRGQNALFSDGSVEFITVRIVDGDDIFTVQNVDAYTGKEVPCNPADIFLVP